MQKVPEALSLHQQWIEERRKADETDKKLRDLTRSMTNDEKEIYWANIELIGK